MERKSSENQSKSDAEDGVPHGVDLFFNGWIYKLYLNQPYPSLIREMNIGNTAALPPTPMPMAQPRARVVDPNTNLTQTEQALLSPEEQVIASRT